MKMNNELNLQINQNIGLEKVIIIYDDKKRTYDIKAQYLNSQKIDYYTISSNIKDADTAKLVKDAYIRGLYDGADFRGEKDE